MPQWIHDRAEHIRAKNPEMPQSMSFAIATQQSHATGKTPKGYGTAEGREEAKEKYTTPGDDKKTADPGGLAEKRAGFFRAVSAVTPIVNEELDERTRHIIREELAKMGPQASPQKPSMKSKMASAVLLPFLDSFSDEIQKIANLNSGAIQGPSTVSSTKSLIPRNTLKTTTPKYTQVNPSSAGVSTQQSQQPLGAPPVRG
jgi:hypothetical protein